MNNKILSLFLLLLLSNVFYTTVQKTDPPFRPIEPPRRPSFPPEKYNPQKPDHLPLVPAPPKRPPKKIY